MSGDRKHAKLAGGRSLDGEVSGRTACQDAQAIGNVTRRWRAGTTLQKLFLDLRGDLLFSLVAGLEIVVDSLAICFACLIPRHQILVLVARVSERHASLVVVEVRLFCIGKVLVGRHVEVPSDWLPRRR